VGCLALFLVGLLGSSLRDMLFVRVSKGDGWLGRVKLACMWGVVVWLVILRRVSVIVRLIFRAGVKMLV
jgi:hypothetical protein